MFNKYVAQIDWNESILVAGFRGGLKDDILDSVAIAETQSCRLHEWMAMASRINERLWGRCQNRCLQLDSLNFKAPIILPSRSSWKILGKSKIIRPNTNGSWYNSDSSNLGQDGCGKA